MSFLGSFVDELFEDLGVVLGGRVVDEFSYFGEEFVVGDLGMAKSVVCGEMETVVVCSENDRQREKVNSHLKSLNQSLVNGCLISEYCWRVVVIGKTQSIETKDGSYQGGW